MSAVDRPLLHFYSYATGVSLELPVGYEQLREDDASAAYAVLDDAGAAAPGTELLVRVVGLLPETSTDTDRAALVAELSAALADQGGEVLATRELVVDEVPVRTLTLRPPDGPGLVHASAAATDTRLLSVVGLAADETMLATYDAALASLRFVEL